MTGKTAIYRRILIAASVAFLTLPLLSKAQDSGHDWYCPDPDTHAIYEKHKKMHEDHEAQAITDLLRKIYTDESLSPEQKTAKAMELIDKYTSKVKMGLGD
jgi:hypothetical protein